MSAGHRRNGKRIKAAADSRICCIWLVNSRRSQEAAEALRYNKISRTRNNNNPAFNQSNLLVKYRNLLLLFPKENPLSGKADAHLTRRPPKTRRKERDQFVNSITAAIGGQVVVGACPAAFSATPTSSSRRPSVVVREFLKSPQRELLSLP